jgi:hydrogenase maturation factor
VTTERPATRAQHCTGDACITCGDVAMPVRITALRPGGLALAATEVGTEEEISIALVDAGVGDAVLVHAGEAIARLDRDGLAGTT